MLLTRDGVGQQGLGVQPYARAMSAPPFASQSPSIAASSSGWNCTARLRRSTNAWEDASLRATRWLPGAGPSGRSATGTTGRWGTSSGSSESDVTQPISGCGRGARRRHRGLREQLSTEADAEHRDPGAVGGAEQVQLRPDPRTDQSRVVRRPRGTHRRRPGRTRAGRGSWWSRRAWRSCRLGHHLMQHDVDQTFLEPVPDRPRWRDVVVLDHQRPHAASSSRSPVRNRVLHLVGRVAGH